MKKHLSDKSELGAFKPKNYMVALWVYGVGDRLTRGLSWGHSGPLPDAINSAREEYSRQAVKSNKMKIEVVIRENNHIVFNYKNW